MVKRGKGIDKRFLVLGIVLFLIFLFMVNIGNSIIFTSTGHQVADSTTGEKIGDAYDEVKDWFRTAFYSETFEGKEPLPSEAGEFGAHLSNLDVPLIRTVLLIIIFFFIITVLSSAGWPKSKFLAFIIALASSYLGSLIITENQIRTIVLGYGALFAAIAVVIPLFVITLFSANLLVARVDKKTGAILKAQLGQVIIVWLLWMFYDLYLLYFVVRTILTPGFAIDWIFAAIMGCAAISTLIIIYFRKSRLWLARLGADLEAEVGKLAQQQVAANTAIAQQVQQGATAATGAAGNP